MRLSRAKAFVPVILALCLAGAGLANAQQNNRPKPLIPGIKKTEALAKPAESEGIQVNRLNAPGRAAVGLLSTEQGGLPDTLWRGSSRAVLQQMFMRLPKAQESAAARSVARSLLLSVGDIPDGSVSDQEMLALRLNALLQMGDPESVVALAEAAGGIASSADVSRPLTEAMFVLNENLRACAVVQSQVRNGGGVYWQQASVFCDLITESPEAADLTLSLLNETGDADKIFSHLVGVVRGKGQAKIAGDAAINALHVTMSRFGSSVSVSDVTKLPAHVAQAFASSQTLPVGQRVQAGALALRKTGLQPGAFLLLLGDTAVTAKQEPLRDAVLEVMNAGSPAVQAEALNDLWQKASARDDRRAAASYGAQFLDVLTPEAGVGFLAAAAMRMALLNGEKDQAQAWYDLLSRVAASGDGDLLKAHTDAQALAQLASLAPRDDRALQNWMGVTDGAQRMLVLLLLDGLGQPARDEVWAELLQAGSPEQTSSDPALWRQMIMAAGGSRTGESVLAALVMTGADGPKQVDARTLSMIVGTLRRAGLDNDARRLAVEALILNGG